MQQTKLIKTKVKFFDLPWKVHSRVSGMTGTVRFDNGYSVTVQCLNIDQEDYPGFRCSYKHTVPKLQTYVSANPAYGTCNEVKGLHAEEVSIYLSKVQALSVPCISQDTIVRGFRRELPETDIAQP